MAGSSATLDPDQPAISRGNSPNGSRGAASTAWRGASSQAPDSAAVKSAAVISPREGAIVRTRANWPPRPEKSRSIASPSGRRSPLMRCMAITMQEHQARCRTGR